MTALENLVIKLIGDGISYQKMLLEAETKTQSFTKNLEKLGQKMTKYLTAPIIAMSGISVKSFADFDLAMTESTSIMADKSAEQVARMKKTALELAKGSSRGPYEIAKAYYFMASAGLDAEQSIAALPAIMNFSKAGAFDLSIATDLLTASQNALDMKVEDVTKNMQNLIKISDGLVRVTTLAQGSTQQFGEALTRDAASAAKQFNIPLDQTLATLGAFADQNIKGAMGGNMFARMLRLLDASARKTAGGMFELDKILYDANGQTRNMADVITGLNNVLGKMSPQARGAALEAMGMKTLSQKAVTPILRSGEKIRKFTGEIAKAMKDGFTDQVATQQMAAFTNQMKRFGNVVTTVAIQVGEILAPYIKKVTDAIEYMLTVWDSWSKEAKLTSIIITGVIAALGPLALFVAVVLPSLVVGFKMIAAVVIPLLPIIAALGLAFMALIGHAGSIEGAWANVKEWAIETWEVAKKKITEFIEWARPIFRAIASFATAAFFAIANVIRWWADLAMKVVGFFIDMFVSDMQKLGEIAGITWDDIKVGIVEAFITAEFVITNFSEITSYAFNLAHLAALTFANDVIDLFERFPTYVMAAAKMIGHNLVAAIYNSNMAFMNLMSNIVSGLVSLPGLISGSLKMEDIFTPLNKGMMDFFGEMPNIAQRELSETEKALTDSVNKQGSELERKYEEFAKAKRDQFFEEPLGEFVGPLFEKGKLPRAAEEAGYEVGESFNKGAKAGFQRFEQVLSGSAEALTRLAEYRERINPQMGFAKGSDNRRVEDMLNNSAEAKTRHEELGVLKDIRDTLKSNPTDLSVEVADLD